MTRPSPIPFTNSARRCAKPSKTQQLLGESRTLKPGFKAILRHVLNCKSRFLIAGDPDARSLHSRRIRIHPVYPLYPVERIWSLPRLKYGEF